MVKLRKIAVLMSKWNFERGLLLNNSKKIKRRRILEGKVIGSNQQVATAAADGSKLPVSSKKFGSKQLVVVLVLVGALAAAAAVATAIATASIAPIVSGGIAAGAVLLIIRIALSANKGSPCVKIAHSKDNQTGRQQTTIPSPDATPVATTTTHTTPGLTHE